MKVAAIIMLFHGFVLTALSFGPADPMLPDHMLMFFMGAMYCGILLVLLLGIILWMLSCLKDKSEIKLLWVVTTATILLGIIEIIFFFPFIVCILPGVLALIALLILNKQK